MATEEFKLLSQELLDNYLGLKDRAKKKGIDTLTVSFKDYLDFYIKYLDYENDLDFDLDESSED